VARCGRWCPACSRRRCVPRGTRILREELPIRWTRP
jgi:hypothetical protein